VAKDGQDEARAHRWTRAHATGAREQNAAQVCARGQGAGHGGFVTLSRFNFDVLYFYSVEGVRKRPKRALAFGAFFSVSFERGLWGVL